MFAKRPKVSDKADQLHFAYGANLNKRTLARRGVTPKDAKPAQLFDVSISMRFQHRGGYATLVREEEPRQKTASPRVNGVLYTVTPEDLQRLCASESGYFLADVQVEAEGMAEEVTASTFVTHPSKLLYAEVAPTARYLGLIQEGAEDAQLERQYREWLASIDPAPFTGRGLGPSYYDSPQKYYDWAGGAVLLATVVYLSLAYL